MNKIKIAVIFGGRSSEHDVSCISAITVINSLNRDKYDVLMVGITKDGHWLKAGSTEEIKSGTWRNSRTRIILSPDTEHSGFIHIEEDKVYTIKADVVFPVLHGLYGEDGTIQGILELADIPYVGCGVVSSAVSMDKLFTKVIVQSLKDVCQAEYVPVRRRELEDMGRIVQKIESKLQYPVFVKPSNAGSSKGVSKASDRNELISGLQNASEHDEKILVEEAINGREIECAVLGTEDAKASGAGEILAASNAKFYDFDAKYNNSESRTVINPELPEGIEQEIRDKAIRIFKAVDGYGLARVDFFVEYGTDRVVFNEINTMPGFTSISMYPMLWEHKGIDKEQLVDALVMTAFNRHR